MAEVVRDAQHEFWQAPNIVPAVADGVAISLAPDMAAACPRCGKEFMISATFCHGCGARRPLQEADDNSSKMVTEIWAAKMAKLQPLADSASAYWHRISFPAWLRYLHFHEIKRFVGLPTASLIAFFIGLGCVAGAVAVSLFYKASNLAEFQAVQMWRIEWLLAATASFVAGILLKSSGLDSDRD